MEILQERKNELADGSSTWYEFEYQDRAGELSVNEYKSSIIPCIVLHGKINTIMIYILRGNLIRIVLQKYIQKDLIQILLKKNLKSVSI